MEWLGRREVDIEDCTDDQGLVEGQGDRTASSSLSQLTTKQGLGT